MIGVDNKGKQLYPSYAKFKEEVRTRFWKDSNSQIKHAQWEKLKQTNLPGQQPVLPEVRRIGIQCQGMHQ